MTSVPGVEVVAANGSGDDAIVELVAGSGGVDEVVVVTADRRLRDRVAELGARSVGPRTLALGRRRSADGHA